jgi:hypothetical protein
MGGMYFEKCEFVFCIIKEETESKKKFIKIPAHYMETCPLDSEGKDTFLPFNERRRFLWE